MAAEIVSTPFANSVCMICAEIISGVELDRFPCRIACGHTTLCLLCAHSLLRKKGVKCLQCGEWTAWSSRADICVDFEIKHKLLDFQKAAVADVVVVPQTIKTNSVSPPTMMAASDGAAKTTPTAAAAATATEDFDPIEARDKTVKELSNTTVTGHVVPSGDWATDVFGFNDTEVVEEAEVIEVIDEATSVAIEADQLSEELGVKKMADNKTINEKSGIRMNTEAIRCAKIGSVSQMLLLLKYGADITICDRDGNTALMNAAQHGRSDNLKVLIDAKANVDAESKSGISALMLAARHDHVRCIELLVKSGANFEKRDQIGQTALMFAAMNAHVKCVKALLEAGANPDAQSKNGDTALILATRWRSSECVGILLRAGANIDIKNISFSPFNSSEKVGKTALEIAREMPGNSICASVLAARTEQLKKVNVKPRFWRNTF